MTTVINLSLCFIGINIFKQYDIHDEIPQPKRLPTPIEKPEHPIEKPKHSIKKEENKSVQVNKKTPENIPKAVEKNSKNLKYHGIPERNPRSLIESVHNTKRSQIETHKDVQKEVKHIPHTSVNHNNIHAVQNDVKNNKQQDHIDSSKAIKPVEEFQIPKEKHVEVIAKTAKEEKHEKPSILDSVEQNVAMQASSKGSKQRYSSIPSSNKSKTKSREFEIPKRNSSRVKENNDGQKVESALPKKTVAMKSSQEPKENKVPKHAINIEIPNPKFKEEEKTSKVPPASKKASKKPTTSKSKKKPAKHSMNRDSQDGRIQCCKLYFFFLINNILFSILPKIVFIWQNRCSWKRLPKCKILFTYMK